MRQRDYRGVGGLDHRSSAWVRFCKLVLRAVRGLIRKIWNMVQPRPQPRRVSWEDLGATDDRDREIYEGYYDPDRFENPWQQMSGKTYPGRAGG